jgi:hypothetical protein
LLGSIGTQPVGALALPQKLARLRIESLTERFKIFWLYLATET